MAHLSNGISFDGRELGRWYDFCCWQIVLKKSFWGDDQNFSGPLMRFARGDMRDHIISHRNDHGASYGRYAVLQWRSRLKISFCEIFGVVQFLTFSTLSAHSSPGHVRRQSQLPKADTARAWSMMTPSRL